GPSLDVHKAQVQRMRVAGDLPPYIDGNLLTAHRIDSDLAGKEEQILVPEQEIEDIGIFQEETPFLRNLYGIGRQVELLLIDIRVRKVSVHGTQGNEVAGEPILHVDSAGVQRTCRLSAQALGSQQHVRFNYQ